ncbi:MAG: hypothetical protein COA45_06910 [Zetaproteobacteria bacterium]|nr:MAG: hypothetical protein COA45_06910 [Zetaproteobacteria bacterium]
MAKITMTKKYNSINEASKGLLADSCMVLKASGIEYVIAGGWIPCLRVKHTDFTHPGTRDVDILFNDDPLVIRKAVTGLMANGYTPSAKHPFQLLKTLNVDGKDMVFNVDLMHPAECDDNPDLYNDIIDFGVPIDYDPDNTEHIKSICFKSSRIIFEQNLWSSFSLEADLPDGKRFTEDIPLMDETSLVLSKCESVKSPKRRRDAFDIYFVLSGPNGEDTANKLKKMAQNFSDVKNQLEKLKKYLTDKSDTFTKNVNHYAYPSGNNGDDIDFSKFVHERLFD